MQSELDNPVGSASLHEVLGRVRQCGDLATLVETVAAAVADGTSFGTVAVNLYRPEWDDYEIVAVHGSDAAAEALLGVSYPSTHWEALLRDEYRRGNAYLVPQGAFDWTRAPVFVPDLPTTGTVDAWHPEDALFVPMHGADGHLLGVISVDEPESGLRPTEDDLQALVAIAAHAALAIQASQSAEAARSHQAALAQLFQISGKLNASGSVDEVLQAVCDAIHEALGFQLVVIETPDATLDRYRPCAAAGVGYDPAVLQIEVPVEQLRRVYAPGFEIEGCYLLPREEALALVGGQPSTYRSQLNGRGPRAWNRHWLIVPLFDANGDELGFIWADDPSDRLLPTRERLQALRLFADNAQRALVSAQQVEAVREAGERQRALVQNSPTGIVLLDVDGLVRDWNDAARKIYGFTDEQVIGQIPPWVIDRDGYAERFMSHVTAEEPEHGEFTDTRADGTLLHAHATSAPLRDADGVITGVIATITDVTAQRVAQREAERQRAEVEALHETTLGLIDRLDLDDVLLSIVNRACDLVGGHGGYLYLIDEVAGLARPAVATGIFSGLITRPLAKGEGIGGRVWESGRPLVVDDYTSWPGRLPFYNDLGYHAVAGVPIEADGRVAGVLGIGLLDEGRTFTAHERTLLTRFAHLASLALHNARLYDALRTSEELYRKVVDNSTELIALSDLEGTIVFASEAHEQVLGYRPEELIGQSLARFAESGGTEKFREVAANVFASGRPAHSVARARHRNGSFVTVQATTAPIYDDDGQPELVLFVARDISEQEHLEEQLRQSQKMEAIGRLAGGIAHDFNNLLTAIGGYAELAAGQVSELSPAQRSLAEIRRASDRAASLTAQLLAYSRKQVLQPKVVDVNDVVNGLREMLTRLLGVHIRLETALDPSVGRTRVDPGQLEQVVMNLVINARDAMSTGGRLSLESANATRDGAPYVLLTVSDTGHGMDTETLAHAFEPFFTTKGPGEGTGLGLSTVYGIVAQTGGHVDAESSPGEGTTVRVYLPRVWEGTDERAHAEAGAAQAGSGTVLLVEDEAVVRDLVCELLQASGYTVLAAADGFDAISIAASHDGRIDALVTDVVMPGMSGPQVAAQLLEKHDGLRVLFTSGYAEDAIATHGVMTPGAAFLGKPFSTAELTAKLRDLLDEPAAA